MKARDAGSLADAVAVPCSLSRVLTFGENISAILQSVEAREEGRHRPLQPKPVVTPRAAPIRSIPQRAV